MLVRKARKEDVKELSILMFELYKKWDRIDPIDKIDNKWFQSRKVYHYISKALAKKDTRILVAEKDQKIVAFLRAQLEERAPFLETAGYIVETFTLPAYRSKGIAKSLVEEAYNWFKKNNIKRIMVGTHSLDSEAINFWKKRGFKEFNKTFKIKI